MAAALYPFHSCRSLQLVHPSLSLAFFSSSFHSPISLVLRAILSKNRRASNNELGVAAVAAAAAKAEVCIVNAYNGVYD